MCKESLMLYGKPVIKITFNVENVKEQINY